MIDLTNETIGKIFSALIRELPMKVAKKERCNDYGIKYVL